MDKTTIDIFTGKITRDFEKDLYYVIIDNKIALLGQALVLGYDTPEKALKAFKSKIYWRTKCYFKGDNRAVSNYVKYMTNSNRLKVMKIKDYIEKLKNKDYEHRD